MDRFRSARATKSSPRSPRRRSPEALEEIRIKVLGRRGVLDLGDARAGRAAAGGTAARRRGAERRQGPDHGGACRGWRRGSAAPRWEPAGWRNAPM